MKTLRKISLLNFGKTEKNQIEETVSPLAHVCNSSTPFFYRHLILTITLGSLSLISCGNKQRSADVVNNTSDSLPVVELQADYPHKDVDIHDLADVTYIPLETTDESLIGTASGFYFCNDTILIEDATQGKVLLFDMKGKYLSSFRHIGNGSMEYTAMGDMCVDVGAHEIFISDINRTRHILVYDFTGKFIRELTIDQDLSVKMIFDYDRDHLLVFNIKDLYKVSSGTAVSGYPYYLVSKQTGKATPVPLWVENRKSDTFVSSDGKGNFYASTMGGYPQLNNSHRGVIISDYALDTVYLYAKQTLEPLLVRHAENDHKGLLSSVFLSDDDFSLIGIAETYIKNNKVESSGERLLYLDHKNGQVNEINLTNKDYPAYTKWFNYAVENYQYPTDVLAVIGYRAELLFEQYHKGGLSGKLKEIVAGLSEEDNPVLMIAKRK